MSPAILNNKPASLLYLLTVLFIILNIACTQDELNTDTGARLKFSSDTISFDTIFTTIGSATMHLKVYNPYQQTILISSISLAGGDQSFFRLNIDGEYTHAVSNIKLPPKDSLYIFLAVTIDPLNSNNPLIIKDSIMFMTNGNYQDVKLLAYGQDVHLIDGAWIGSETWISDKPYLLYNTVIVDTAETLVIEQGTQLFFHREAALVVYGNIIVNGSMEYPVVFQNDRLEEFYDIVSGQWGTIYIDPISTGNSINHAIIKNAITGLQVGSPSATKIPSIEIHNSIIQNMSFAGIYACGANITCSNTVIVNCGGPALAFLKGGAYTILHCTVSNNGVIGTSRNGTSVELSNYCFDSEYNPETGTYTYFEYSGDLDEAAFHNCILYGNALHELEFNDNNENVFNYYFNHCLIKASETLIDTGDPVYYNSVILNEYPAFVNDSDRYHLDLQLDTLSTAKDAGDPGIIGTYTFLEYDMNGNLRNIDTGPDLGAYERREN